MCSPCNSSVHRAVTGNWGNFGVPNSRVEHDYAGVVKKSFELRVGGAIKFILSALWVIENPFPLFLVGANVLCWGQKAPSWTYEGISLKTYHGTGAISRSISFRHESKVEELPLAQAA